MKISKFLSAACGLAIAASAVPANAAIITKTLTLTGDFESTAAVPSQGKVTFSLNFDNSSSFIGDFSKVATVSNNLFGPLQVAYDHSGDFLYLVGGNGSALSFGCQTNAASFCSFIYSVSSDAPSSNFIVVNDLAGNTQFGNNVKLVSGVAAAVPEPATWALMLGGFGMIGFAARRRQSVKTTVTFA